jgi:hypothetical protein
MSEPSETEKVGYKRPPSKTRFQPGKSGNPRGRPKRKVNMSESFNRELDQKIVLPETGKVLTKLEAFVHSTLNRVLQGDAKAIPALVRLLNQTEQFKPIPIPGQMTGVVVQRPAYFDDPFCPLPDTPGRKS